MNLLCVIRTHWAYIMAIRFLVGIPAAALTTTVPMWLSEMAETNKRGYLSIGFQLFGCAGMIIQAFVLLLIMYMMLEHQQNLYWLSFVISAIMCFFAFLGCMFLKETKEVQSVEDGQKAEMTSTQISWAELFKRKDCRIPLTVAFTIGIC